MTTSSLNASHVTLISPVTAIRSKTRVVLSETASGSTAGSVFSTIYPPTSTLISPASRVTALTCFCRRLRAVGRDNLPGQQWVPNIGRGWATACGPEAVPCAGNRPPAPKLPMLEDWASFELPLNFGVDRPALQFGREDIYRPPSQGGSPLFPRSAIWFRWAGLSLLQSTCNPVLDFELTSYCNLLLKQQIIRFSP